MIMKCRYCGTIMDKTHESTPKSSYEPYTYTYTCSNCMSLCEFDEAQGQVEAWIKKDGEIEIVEFGL